MVQRYLNTGSGQTQIIEIEHSELGNKITTGNIIFRNIPDNSDIGINAVCVALMKQLPKNISLTPPQSSAQEEFTIKFNAPNPIKVSTIFGALKAAGLAPDGEDGWKLIAPRTTLESIVSNRPGSGKISR